MTFFKMGDEGNGNSELILGLLFYTTHVRIYTHPTLMECPSTIPVPLYQ